MMRSCRCGSKNFSSHIQMSNPLEVIVCVCVLSKCLAGWMDVVVVYQECTDVQYGIRMRMTMTIK